MGFVGKWVALLIGMYAGIYADQHYQLPRVDDPKALWQKVQEFADKYKKDGPPRQS